MSNEILHKKKIVAETEFFCSEREFLILAWERLQKRKGKKKLCEDAQNGREIEGKGNALSIFMFNEMNNGMKKITKLPCKALSMSSAIVTSRAFLFGVCDNDNHQLP